MKRHKHVVPPTATIDDDVLYDVVFGSGKYRLVYYNSGLPRAFRNGERWEVCEADMLGNKMLMALVAELVEMTGLAYS